ncbi:chromatin structure-remodeling complex protein SYD-like isoform X2 [Primulina tabacum]|uniref:chromatin structure-remodeling complex protein SYD-like isoform X2 n=1 Tax=Primulina tabacum TaxID=48773 RepID=UPI003F5910F0
MAVKPVDPGGSSMASNANKPAQGSIPSSLSEAGMLRNVAPRDTGKSSVSLAPGTGLLFTNQQLKQLRAQCLVFLSFRNGLLPKQLHLEIALGNLYFKEDGPHRDLIDQKGKEQIPTSVPEASRPLDKPASSKPHPSILESSSLMEANNAKVLEEKSFPPAILFENEQDRNHLLATRKIESEIQSYEGVGLHSSVTKELRDLNLREISTRNLEDDSWNN